jgi:hypothetical protein
MGGKGKMLVPTEPMKKGAKKQKAKKGKKGK